MAEACSGSETVPRPRHRSKRGRPETCPAGFRVWVDVVRHPSGPGGVRLHNVPPQSVRFRCPTCTDRIFGDSEEYVAGLRAFDPHGHDIKPSAAHASLHTPQHAASLHRRPPHQKIHPGCARGHVWAHLCGHLRRCLVRGRAWL